MYRGHDHDLSYSTLVTLLLINKVYIDDINKDEKILILKNRNYKLFYNDYAIEKKIKLKYLPILDISDFFKHFFYNNKSYIIIIYIYLKNILKNLNFILFNKKNNEKNYFITFSTTGEFNLNKNFYNSETFFYNYSQF